MTVEHGRQRVDEDLPEDCSVCGKELVVIGLLVDRSDLVMASCEVCDTTTWRRSGKPIELDEALAQVGQHAGRRRS